MDKKDFVAKIAPGDTGKVFFCSDTHGFHQNILKYCDRPFASVEEMNGEIVRRWNSVVGPDDHVYHLGDFCFGNVAKWNWFLEPGRLNGHIHLILGNHDVDRVFREGTLIDRFDEITFQKVLVIEGWTVILNHFPFRSFSNNFDHKVLQLFGHIHSGPRNRPGWLRRLKDVLGGWLGFKLQWNQYDVGMDNNDYTPVSWAQVKERMRLDEYTNANK